jgi:hypothetical protein
MLLVLLGVRRTGLFTKGARVMFTRLTGSLCAVTPRFLLPAVLVLAIVLVGTPAWAAVETFKLQWAAIDQFTLPMWSNGTTTATLEPWTEPVSGGGTGYHLSFRDLFFLCTGLGTNQETCEVASAYTAGQYQGSMVVFRDNQAPGDATLRLDITAQGHTTTVLIGVGTKETVPLRVFITQPKTGATVSGTVWVVMWVEGTSGASNVFTLSADGKQVGSQTTSSRGPVTIPWVTKPVGATPVPNGTHTLTGTVRDATGNTGTTSISVILRN